MQDPVDKMVDAVAKELWLSGLPNENEPWEKIAGSEAYKYWMDKARVSIRVVLENIGEVDKDAEIARLNNELNMSNAEVMRCYHLLSARNERLERATNLLQELHDIQNGAPLITVEGEWSEIMHNIEKEFLSEKEE